MRYLLQQLQLLAPRSNVGPDDVIASFAGIRALIRSHGRKPSKRSREERIKQTNENLISVAGGKYTTFRAIADKVVRRAYRVLGQQRSECLTASTPLVDHRPKSNGDPLATATNVFKSEVAFACSDEMASTVEDFMRRRSSLALGLHGGIGTAEEVSRIMAEQLDWSDEFRQRQVASYLASR